MTIEELEPDEWWRLGVVFVEEFGTQEVPDPKRTKIYVGVEDGRVVGFFLMERVIHAGPFWVAPNHRGKGVARRLAEEALRLAEGEEGYIAATRPEVEHLAESLGLTKIEGSLWCKEA